MVSIDSFGADKTLVFPIVIFIVLCSIFIHGGSVGLFHIGMQMERTREQNQTNLNNLRRDRVITNRNSIVVIVAPEIALDPMDIDNSQQNILPKDIPSSSSL